MPAWGGVIDEEADSCDEATRELSGRAGMQMPKSVLRFIIPRQVSFTIEKKALIATALI